MLQVTWGSYKMHQGSQIVQILRERNSLPILKEKSERFPSLGVVQLRGHLYKM